MEAKITFVCACLVVLVCIRSSEGIECYVCATGSTGCNDPFDSNAVPLVNCIGDVSCMKTKAASGDAQAVSRGCHSSKVDEGCQQVDVVGVSTDLCYCNSDGCNPAVTTKLSTGLLVFVSLAYLLYRVF